MRVRNVLLLDIATFKYTHHEEYEVRFSDNIIIYINFFFLGLAHHLWTKGMPPPPSAWAVTEPAILFSGRELLLLFQAEVDSTNQVPGFRSRDEAQGARTRAIWSPLTPFTSYTPLSLWPDQP